MPTTERARIVVDTSVAISAALLPQSAPAKAFALALMKFQLVASDSTIAELVEVIYRPKFVRYLNDETILEFLSILSQSSEFITVTSKVNDRVDPKDNQFLELALDAQAKIILSSDPHLTSMHPYKGISIMTPRSLIELFSNQQ